LAKVDGQPQRAVQWQAYGLVFGRAVDGLADLHTARNAGDGTAARSDRGRSWCAPSSPACTKSPLGEREGWSFAVLTLTRCPAARGIG